MMVPMTLGQTLRQLREAQGLSRRKLGYRIDRSEGAIRNWEADEDSPNRESLDALARVLGPEIIAAAFPDLLTLPVASGENPCTLQSVVDLHGLEMAWA
jgi:transcriptional regulator with XRE-family HTH domain